MILPCCIYSSCGFWLPLLSFLFFVTQEGRTIKSSSGFKGKGFKFDEMEAQLADDRKKLQKAALGLHDSDDEDAGMDVSVCVC